MSYGLWNAAQSHAEIKPMSDQQPAKVRKTFLGIRPEYILGVVLILATTVIFQLFR
jgi:hypothetical protein